MLNASTAAITVWALLISAPCTLLPVEANIKASVSKYDTIRLDSQSESETVLESGLLSTFKAKKAIKLETKNLAPKKPKVVKKKITLMPKLKRKYGPATMRARINPLRRNGSVRLDLDLMEAYETMHSDDFLNSFRPSSFSKLLISEAYNIASLPNQIRSNAINSWGLVKEELHGGFLVQD